MKKHSLSINLDYCPRCTARAFPARLSKLYERFRVAEEAQINLADGVVRNVIAHKQRVPAKLFRMAKKANRATKYWRARQALDLELIRVWGD